VVPNIQQVVRQILNCGRSVFAPCRGLQYTRCGLSAVYLTGPRAHLVISESTFLTNPLGKFELGRFEVSSFPPPEAVTPKHSKANSHCIAKGGPPS